MMGDFSKTHLLGENSIFLVNEYLFNFCCPIIIYKSYRVESFTKYMCMYIFYEYWSAVGEIQIHFRCFREKMINVCKN
jgi:hypothetical protein